MKTTYLFFIQFFFLLCFNTPYAQNNILSQQINLSYKNVKLEKILANISRKYDVHFSYSDDVIPVDKRISIKAKNTSLASALQHIAQQANIEYALIGNNIVLRKKKSSRKIGKKAAPPSESPSQHTAIAVFDFLDHTIVPKPLTNSRKTIDVPTVQLPLPPPEPIEQMTQITVLPYISTSKDQGVNTINRFSVNILWGHNGGLYGTEAGLLFNSIRNNVKGIQIAGAGNIVGGEVRGTQVALLFNINNGKTYGFQGSGLANIIADDLFGTQFSMGGNIVSGNTLGLQIGGIFNICGNRAHAQGAGLFNWAGDVNRFQISGLFNRAKKVEGFQLGLINICDTITGAPIGLINIVKKGYNRIEISGSEFLHTSVSLKFGGRRFYNILQVGNRWDSKTWGLGYGLGTIIRISHHLDLNTELAAFHINEREVWTDKLNLLTQFRLTLDLHSKKGPAFSSALHSMPGSPT